jgi:AcrR family transcriptional regulator
MATIRAPRRSPGSGGGTGRPRPARKRRDRYHHGDLRRALLQEALGTIESHGVEGLTLRAVGNALGVSRTALYRHFADKSALLAAVAREGFRTLRLELLAAWDRGGGGSQGFDAMGVAYVRFASAHPAHYRVMFGGFVSTHEADAELLAEASGAFKALVDALVTLQQGGLIVQDDPLQLARFVWAIVHGIARLAIDGQLHCSHAETDALTRFALNRLRTGIGSAAG